MMETTSRIPEKLFFRIGEVCELIKVQPHVLRYWESEFPMLAPQKNRAGQRVYRRKDVEMVMRIRDLLYEEKFTIAGAKRKLMEETRGGSSRVKIASRETPPIERETAPIEEVAGEPEQRAVPASPPERPIAQPVTPEARLAIRVLRRDLEDLLTMLKSDASIKN
jgi:DNA-binding transcriptional MerR regulator